MPNGARLMIQRDRLGDVLEDGLGGLPGAAQRDAENDRPCQDADEVALHERVDGVGEDVGHEREEHGADALGGGGDVFGRIRELDVDREGEAHEHGDKRREDRRHDVEQDDGLHGAGGLGVGKRA